MNIELKKQLLAHLNNYITDNKVERISKILPERTRYITVALENIYQSQNASAVVRTCDCFGVQDLHIIENSNKYDINPKVIIGSSKWVNMIKYNEQENNTKECIETLKAKGYRIVATSPHAKGCELQDLDLEKGKVAIMFGTEQDGLSDLALDMADEYVKIPMYGFSESLNISNSAAITLHHLVSKLKRTSIDWKLSEEETLDINIAWVKTIIKKGEQIEATFLENLKNNQ